MPTGRHMGHESHKHGGGMHTKQELKKKLAAHRHKIPGYLAREMAKTDVPAEIAKAGHPGKPIEETKH